jgi:hypothetical protein
MYLDMDKTAQKGNFNWDKTLKETNFGQIIMVKFLMKKNVKK